MFKKKIMLFLGMAIVGVQGSEDSKQSLLTLLKKKVVSPLWRFGFNGDKMFEKSPSVMKKGVTFDSKNMQESLSFSISSQLIIHPALFFGITYITQKGCNRIKKTIPSGQWKKCIDIALITGKQVVDAIAFNTAFFIQQVIYSKLEKSEESASKESASSEQPKALSVLYKEWYKKWSTLYTYFITMSNVGEFFQSAKSLATFYQALISKEGRKRIFPLNLKQGGYFIAGNCITGLLLKGSNILVKFLKTKKPVFNFSCNVTNKVLPLVVFLGTSVENIPFSERIFSPEFNDQNLLSALIAKLLQKLHVQKPTCFIEALQEFTPAQSLLNLSYTTCCSGVSGVLYSAYSELKKLKPLVGSDKE